MRYPLQPLLDAAGLTMAGLNARIRMGGETYRRAQQDGLSELVADRWANRLGLHPAEVWPEWLDGAGVECALDGCEEWFVPTRAGHRYHDQRCARKAWARTTRGKASLAAAKARWLEVAYEYDRKRERERKRRIRAAQRSAA